MLSVVGHVDLLLPPVLFFSLLTRQLSIQTCLFLQASDAMTTESSTRGGGSEDASQTQSVNTASVLIVHSDALQANKILKPINTGCGPRS